MKSNFTIHTEDDYLRAHVTLLADDTGRSHRLCKLAASVPGWISKSEDVVGPSTLARSAFLQGKP